MTQPVDIVRAANEAQPPATETAPTASTPRSPSSWLLPHSPAARSARSPSPVVGGYFGTGQRLSATPEAPPRRGTTPLDDDDDLDFWGRPNSPREGEADEASSESESESDSDEAMEDDDDEEDAMDLIGHR